MRTSPRAPLSRERILSAALSVADRDGLPALSMRRLGAALGVEAMSLYGHVRDKGDLLDGLVDHVVGMWADPLPDESDWRVVARTTMARASGKRCAPFTGIAGTSQRGSTAPGPRGRRCRAGPRVPGSRCS